MILKRILLVFLFCLVSVFSWAQPGRGPGGQPQDPQRDPDKVPITGLEYLILAGGAYGVYRYSNRRNKPPKVS